MKQYKNEYEIISFDPSTSIMVWKIKNNKKFQLSLEDENLTNYLEVHTSHYLDTSTNNIVMINTPSNRVGFVENNHIYIRATQFDFDQWNYKLNKSFDNSKVYAILMKHINELH